MNIGKQFKNLFLYCYLIIFIGGAGVLVIGFAIFFTIFTFQLVGEVIFNKPVSQELNQTTTNTQTKPSVVKLPTPTLVKPKMPSNLKYSIGVDDTITRDNWECTGDCSGHEAGYEWADEKGITDPSDCGGKSGSFIEGCEAYANEQ